MFAIGFEDSRKLIPTVHQKVPLKSTKLKYFKQTFSVLKILSCIYTYPYFLGLIDYFLSVYNASSGPNPAQFK